MRTYLKTIKGFKNIRIVESETNKGLANSIISGVSEIMKFSDKVIVLEDDLLTTPNFLVVMNKALKKYENDQKVFPISGYAFNLKNEDKLPNNTYFLNRAWPWGWATWKTNWENIDWEVKDYPHFKKDKIKKAEFGESGIIYNFQNYEDISHILECANSGLLPINSGKLKNHIAKADWNDFADFLFEIFKKKI